MSCAYNGVFLLLSFIVTKTGKIITKCQENARFADFSYFFKLHYFVF